MYNKEKFVQAIIQQGVLPLYFNSEEEVSIRILEALYNSGIRVIEYTNRGKAALKNFRSLRKYCNKNFPEIILGLGTVLDTKTASKAIENGADFLVSPGYSKELDRLSELENTMWIPGCMTASDLMQAQGSGARLVKLFPAHLLGPSFIGSVKGLFPDLLFMATGGIDTGNLESWLRAGSVAVGMGGSLISTSAVANKDYEAIKSNTAAIIKQIAAVRSTMQPSLR